MRNILLEHKPGETLRIHRFLPRSYANGPGARAVLWVQGCALGCPGCFNPETHPFSGGETVAVDTLVQRLVDLQDTIAGFTISGGEPLQQRRSLLTLLQKVRRRTSLSVIVYTGYTWEEVQAFPEKEALLAAIDVVSAGRYEAERRWARDLRGSSNKTLHFLTGRYTPADLAAVPAAEVIVTEEGEVLLSGIDPIRPGERRGEKSEQAKAPERRT